MVQTTIIKSLVSFSSVAVLGLSLSACRVQLGGGFSSGYQRPGYYNNGWPHGHHHGNHRPNRDRRGSSDRQRQNPDRDNGGGRREERRPNRPRPNRRDDNNQQASFEQKIRSATLGLNAIALKNNPTQVKFVKHAQSGDVQMQLTYLDNRSKKRVVAPYNLNVLDIPDSSNNPAQVKVGFCRGEGCADSAGSANAWQLIVDRSHKTSVLQDANGKQVELEYNDVQKVLRAADQIVNEVQAI